MNKKTVIVGASTNPDRYAYLAAKRLKSNQIPFVPVGIKRGNVLGEEILDLREQPAVEGVDTITLYLNPRNQEMWEDYILNLQPKRIIFNPGTENERLRAKAENQGIDTEYACTLVMLSAGVY